MKSVGRASAAAGRWRRVHAVRGRLWGSVVYDRGGSGWAWDRVPLVAPATMHDRAAVAPLAALPTPPAPRTAGEVYVLGPPPGDAAAERAAARQLAAGGAAVLWLALGGEAWPEPASSIVVVVVPRLGEPVDAVSVRRMMSAAPAGTRAGLYVPLLPGETTDPALLAQLAEATRDAAGCFLAGHRPAESAAALQAVCAQLVAARGAGAGDALFDRAFAAGAEAYWRESERCAAAAAAAAGLAGAVARPLPEGELAGNIAAAAELVQLAETCATLPAGEIRAAGLVRAALALESLDVPFAALARYGNLGAVAAIGEEARQHLSARAAGSPSPLDPLQAGAVPTPAPAPAGTGRP